MATVALKFGPVEYFWLAVFGLTLIASLGEGSTVKGLIGGCVGLLLSMVGVAEVGGDVRYVGDFKALLGGIDVVSALIGLLNGFMVAYVGIPSFMMTLAMLTIARGMSIFVSEGKPIFEVPPVLKQLGSVSSQVFGIPVIGIFAVGQFIEGNFLSPKLVGSSIGLHPVWLMFALFAFGYVFGFVGLLLAVPLAAAAGVLVRFALNKYLGSKLYRGVPREMPTPRKTSVRNRAK